MYNHFFSILASDEDYGDKASAGVLFLGWNSIFLAACEAPIIFYMFARRCIASSCPCGFFIGKKSVPRCGDC